MALISLDDELQTEPTEVAQGNLIDLDAPDEAQAQVEPKQGRTFGEVAKDTGASILGATLGVAKVGAKIGDKLFVGQGEANPAIQFLNEYGESVNDQKSDYLKSKQAAQGREIAQAEDQARAEAGDGWQGDVAGFLAGLKKGATTTLSDPALLLDMAAQQIPMMGAMGGGSLLATKLASGAATIAPKAAATTAGKYLAEKAGVGGSMGAGMALQGSDIGSQTYKQMMELPDEVWQQNPEFVTLAQSQGAQAAKHEIADRESSKAGGYAALASLATMAVIPGGKSIEKAMAGGKPIPVKAIPGAMAGETLQEGSEEGLGQLAGNVGVAAVDPSQRLMEGVGGATGQGAVAGGLMAGGINAVRAFQSPRDELTQTLDDQIAKGNSPLSRAAATNPDLKAPPVVDPLQGATNGLPSEPVPTDPVGAVDPAVDPAAGLGAGPGVDPGAAPDAPRPLIDDLGDAAGDPNAAAADALRGEPGSPLVVGEPLDDEWTAFHPESGTLNVPREQMPQIKSEHRSAMVNFLKARGVDTETDSVAAEDLKPTQDKFAPAKVKQAAEFEGSDRPVLVSSDGHVLDGHHQWLAKAMQDAPVPVIRLNAPIAQLLTLMEEFPSAGKTKTQPKEKADVIAPIQAEEEGPATSGATAPVARTQVAAPQTILAQPASPTNTGTVQVRQRRAQLAHMAGRGFIGMEERDGVTYLVNQKQSAEMPLGSSVDVALARQAVVAAGGTGDTVRQTTGVQNGQDIGAAGDGVGGGLQSVVGRGSSAPAYSGSDARVAPGSGRDGAAGAAAVAGDSKDRRTQIELAASENTALIQRSITGIEERRKVLQKWLRKATAPDVQADLSKQIRELPNIQVPPKAELDAFSELKLVWTNAFGSAPVVGYWDNRADGTAADGFEQFGVAHINLARPHMALQWTLGHEFEHVTEKNQTPAQARLREFIWNGFTEQGKRAFFEGFLDYGVGSYSVAMADPATYSAQLSKLKKEMLAEFMGARFTDKTWLAQMAKQKPNLFGAFIKDWLATLDNMIASLKSYIGIDQDSRKNVDKYLKDLKAAKAAAMELAISWAEKNPKLAQGTGADTAIQKSQKFDEDIDLDFMQELQAELDQEQAQDAPDESVSDDQIEMHGLQAEDAFPELYWEKKAGGLLRTTIPGLYTADGTASIQLEPEGKGLFGGMMRGTWIGPANTETVGYATLDGAKAFVHRYVASKELRDRKFDLLSTVTPTEKKKLVQAWKKFNQAAGVRRYAQADKNLPMKAIAQQMGITKNYDVRISNEVMDSDARTVVVEFTNLAKDHLGEQQMAILELNKVDGKWLGTANTSGLIRGGMGAAVYQMFSEYAASRDITIHPDHSLSGVNTYRRSEQMLSAAMRLDKSNVMVPHPVQRLYGFNNEAKTPKEHDDNIARMLLAGLRNARELVPDVDGLTYEPETGEFFDDIGKLANEDVEEILHTTDARAFGMGRSTLARAVLAKMILNGEELEAKSFREPVLYSERDHDVEVQLSMEYKPGFSTGVMTGMNTEMDSDAQKAYLQDMHKALSSNVPSVRSLLGWGKRRYHETVTGGAWKALSGWSIQATLSLPNGIIDEQTEHEINFFLATHGMLTAQEAMASHLPTFGAKGVGVEFNLGGKKLSAEQFEEVYASVMHEFKNYSIPPIPSKDGLRFLNYTGLKQDEFVRKLVNAIGETSVAEIWDKAKDEYDTRRAAKNQGQDDGLDSGMQRGSPDLSRKSGNDDLSAFTNEGIRQFSHVGPYIENDWRAGENGYRELIVKSWEYLKGIPGSKMPQTLEALNKYLDTQQENADGVNQFYAEEFGLSKPTLSKEERATGVKENYEFPPRNTFKTVRARNAFFKNPDGSLMTLYHGGTPIEELEQRSGISLFASTAPSYGNAAAKMAAEFGEDDATPVVYPLNVIVQRPFDWRISSHRDSIKMTSYPKGVTEKSFQKKLKQGDFETIESPEFVAAAKLAGFDAVLVRDESVFSGFLNVGVFDIRDVMFAIAPIPPKYDYAEALAAKWPRMRRFNLARDGILHEVEQQAEDGIEAASVLRLIAHTGFRVGGNPGLSGKHEAFGATTLKPEHVKIDGDTISFDFIGKAGVPQKHSIVNPKIARDLEKRMGRDRLFDVNDRGMRKFLKAITAGSDFKIHDFRTWVATDAAKKVIEAHPAPTDAQEFAVIYKLAIQAAASKIGDTTAVTEQSYVDPNLFDGIRKTSGVLASVGKGDGQHEAIDTTGVSGPDESAVSAIQRSERDSTEGGRPGAGSYPRDSATVRAAIHFGKQTGLSYLSGSSSGTGIKGAEQERLQNSSDPRIKRRVYFYLPVEGGIPQPEIGLGGAVYEADIDGLYDFRTAEKPIRGAGNDFETALLDQGYRGYIAPEQGTIVILNEDVPVRGIGGISDHKVIKRNIERIVPKNVTRVEGSELVRKPEPVEMSQLANPGKQAKIREAAPSFRLEYGYIRVRANEAPAADQAIAEFSPTFRFGELQRSARDVPPATRRELERRRDIMKRLRACLG